MLQRGRLGCEAGRFIDTTALAQPQSHEEAIADIKRDAERVGGVCAERASFRGEVSRESAPLYSVGRAILLCRRKWTSRLLSQVRPRRLLLLDRP
jgi:hypothetical protein